MCLYVCFDETAFLNFSPAWSAVSVCSVFVLFVLFVLSVANQVNNCCIIGCGAGCSGFGKASVCVPCEVWCVAVGFCQINYISQIN